MKPIPPWPDAAARTRRTWSNMTDNAVLTATFIAIAAGMLVWATVGMIVRLVRHRRSASEKSE